MPKRMFVKTIRLETQQDRSTVVQRLQEQTAWKKPYWRRRLVGRVNEAGFKLNLYSPLLQAGATPVIHGSFESQEDTTVIIARIRPSGLTLFELGSFSALLVIAVPYVIIDGRYGDALSIGLPLFILLAFVTLLHTWNIPRTIRLFREAALGAA